jgi:SnoaL-like protein
MDDDTLAHLAITRLHCWYTDIASRQAWEEMVDLALADASFSFDLGGGRVLEFVGAELGSFGPRATAQFSFYEYLPMNTVVTVTSEATATGRSYALEVGVDKASDDWIEVYGVYDDDYVMHDGKWMFSRRASVEAKPRRKDPRPFG